MANDHLTVELVRPSELTKDSSTLARTVALMTRITSPAIAKDAGVFLRMVRERKRRIAAHYKEIRKPLRDALHSISEMEQRDIAPWEAADVAVSSPLTTWLLDQKKAADAENKRRIAEAEQRALDERAHQVETLRAAADAAPTTRIARDLRSQARRVEAAPVLPVIDGAVAPPKLDGIATPVRRSADVIDMMSLVQAVAAGKVPLSAVVPNQKWLDAQATDIGPDMNYPGVVVREDVSLTARGLR